MSVHHHFGIRALGEIRGKTGALRYTLRAASCDGIVNQFHLTLHLLYRLAGGALGILELALAIALLAEISTIEQLVPDLLQRQTAAGGMFCPRHISAVKIAAVDGIGMKFFERLDARVLSASALVRADLLLARRFALVIFRDAGNELDCARVNASGR